MLKHEAFRNSHRCFQFQGNGTRGNGAVPPGTDSDELDGEGSGVLPFRNT
ncbi:MAG: hypothetical protein JW875_07020 [Spirochaetales bacterium]|nr:hypothetical protein [Spirochaetales bacterium]